MSARDAILARLKGAAPDRAQADALLIAPERPAVDPAALEAEFLARLALPSVSASHDAIATLADLPAAIARRGIAETGSLVFETGPAAPMLPNFLALHHIVLLASRDIAPYLEDAPLPGPQPRAHYWITGVSGTTDIEGTYVRGAHGPRFLHVILLRN